MRLSVVIPYYNRRELLINVLESMNKVRDMEIIVVDDGSAEENRIEDLKFENLKVIRLDYKAWRGPCVAYNTGFKAATGDVVVINSSECIHRGNVLKYVLKHFKPRNYLCFSAYIMGENEYLTAPRFDNFWGVHSTIKNLIPYCAAIERTALEELGGYDERFANGTGFDDYDFTHRVKNLGLITENIDDPFVIHQYHTPTVYTDYKNLDLLNYLNDNFPNRIRANVAS